MIKKLTAVIFALVVLSVLAVSSNAMEIRPTGFTSDQIFNIIDDRDPDIRFEAAQKFSQIFGG